MQEFTAWRCTQTPQRRQLIIYEQASEWLRSCLSTHKDCQYRSASSTGGENDTLRSRLPRRLIDVTHGDSVYIIDCVNWVTNGMALFEDLQEYCTLSYQWGATSHNCVLQGPFSLMLEVAIDTMPQTFVDAIIVTKKLGIQFLWIDALCIIQPSFGDATDWLEEGPRMDVVYENAICTIAATAAAHADEGFLAAMENHGTFVALRYCVSNAHLNNRGWVVQERALSKRILHFTEQGLFWECGSLKANAECEPDGVTEHGFSSCGSKETLLSVSRVRRTRHICPREWLHFVERYSSAELKNPNDRLLAFSSVARTVQPFFGRTEYLAGLWRHDLVRGLA